MTIIWVSDSYILSLNKAILLWCTRGQRFLTLSVSPLTNNLSGQLYLKKPLSYRIRDIHYNWKNSQKSCIRRLCPCRGSSLKHRVLLYTSASSFSTSACLSSTDQSYRMSRLKNTLESVSKAVSGTQAEIFSRIARLKPSARDSAVGAETTPLQDQSNGSALATSSPTLVSHPPSSTNTSTNLPESAPVSSQYVQAEVKSNKSQSQTSKSTGPAATRASTSAPPPASFTSSRQTTHLFHPGSFSVNLDETYNSLAHHINSYFSSFTMDQEKNMEGKGQTSTSTSDSCHHGTDVKDQTRTEIGAPVSDPGSALAPKKGLGHYLTYKPTVQAFVGNYIAPLVPRFRTEPKNTVTVTDKPLPSEDDASKPKEVMESKEQKAAEEKARRLLLQREKVLNGILMLNNGVIKHNTATLRVIIYQYQQ